MSTPVSRITISRSSETGRLLYLLVRANGARNIVEFGTSFGISTIHLAAALSDNGGGHIIGTEFEPGKIDRTRQNLRQTGLQEFVEIRAGDALETLASGLPPTIDFVLLDGAKALYLPVLRLLEPCLRSGALILADNAKLSPGYLETMRASEHYLSVSCGEDLELSLRL